MGYEGPLEQIDANSWRIPKSYKSGMRVDGVIFADDAMMKKLRHDQAPDQVANVATLPGIQRASFAMPDIHWGYGFCIGGVCATDPDDGGVISPGGVGYDINCGVRLIRSHLTEKKLGKRLRPLVDALFEAIPTGVGRGSRFRFSEKEIDQLLAKGPGYLVRDRGIGCERDLLFTEANGCLEGARPDFVSQRAKQRGASQCGSLGSGNHFAEVQVVDHVFDEKVAATLGLFQGQVCVMIHSGSRGLGYQVCDDTLRVFRDIPAKYGIDLPDRQLACAPIVSEEGERYLGAMRAAANYAWGNRHLLMHQVREVFEEQFDRTWEDLGMDLVYDIAHNIAKFEEHDVAPGTKRRVCVHRKGATRAFPPGHPELPDEYQSVGQPVMIPGDMGTASYVLVGAPGSMERTFGTTCHGAGRQMSRTASVKAARGRNIAKELAGRGVIARAHSRKGLEEEQPDAYKDVSMVVEVVARAGLSNKVARMRPIGVIKG
ncbi:RNA-splicing ligase RtcB [Planctomycetes bacterium Pan216]|uniref:tRNA-splicing ligase RtcB n=1 Tax=Kolteria novifilia TaxID=2527975 RepID=A0A518B8E1_9BACT|nr:RNA-splicing ligase RtcB [Planctomycetes bacterium Pan216]